MIRIHLLLVTSGQKYGISTAVDMVVAQLKSALILRAGIPSRFENGRPVEYALDNRTQGRRLQDNLTLRENGVQLGEDDSLD